MHLDQGNASSRKISRDGFARAGSSNVPTFRTRMPDRAPGSSAMDDPHSGQKWRRIGLPLPPMLLNVFNVPVILTFLLAGPNQCGKGAAGEPLAVATMADRPASGIRLGGVTHRAAKATAQNRHHPVAPLNLPSLLTLMRKLLAR
jgi:hypothetical protein